MARTRNGSIRKIIILGAGTVGRHIAHLLQQEDVDVVLIDNDPSVLQEVEEIYDIQTVRGNGASPETLEKAGVAESDLVLAFTDSCEVNLLAAFIAKEMGALRTVVRSRAPWNMDRTRVDLRKRLDVDLLLNPELLTAAEIAKFLDNPDALALTHFAHGRVQLRQFILEERSHFCNRSLIDCQGQIPPGVLVAMRARDNEVSIPRGNSVLLAGDKLTLIGLPDRLSEAQRLFHAPSEPVRRVTIAGGGISGYFLATTLEAKSFDVKLVEPNPERCEYLSAHLHRTRVIRGDVTRLGLMQEERIGASDVFIAVMRDDEDNLMACLLAKELGAKQTVARIGRPDYASLVQKMGIELALSPRHIMADRIMAMVRGGRIKAISLLEEGTVEVVELHVDRPTDVTGRRLIDVGKQLPGGVLISTIVRGSQVIVPGGEDTIEVGDTVIVLGLREKMEEVEALFSA